MQIEKLGADSNMSLEQHQKDVLGAIADVVDKASSGKGPTANENPFVNETITAAVGGSAFAMAVTAREESRKNSGGSVFVNTSQSPNSLFVGGGAETGKAAHARVSMVPMSYGEKKEAARQESKAASKKAEKDGNVFAGAQVAGQSLTGASSSGGKPVPIKGATVTPAMAAALGISELINELAVTTKALQNPYENSAKRLADELGKGIDRAEEYVQRKPEVVKALKLPVAPAPPTGAQQ